ncbi:MAG: MarR family transcriptional regulator [Methanobrevibacter sp.]|uniref:MarR family winged helix-turn-helix transcriptional regulator n=1 Tax=Methanobrevibacter sp. TaxID=66852 RepID=UPI001B213E95|nr:MarR family transcriptional regulator [Methanobrevibacter sp.]MBO6111159.1 MarR family transcriptional regulator [Methanobrevibacter sp.]MBP3791053.1 MarR family transcriptional regulator [Methanobrevibacter sp.]
MDSLDFDQVLFRINKLYTENTNSNLKEFNVTRSDMSFLLKLNEMGKVTQKDLAESRNLNNATVTRALERLEKKGFVKRIDDENDKRKRIVLLTSEGKQTINEILKKHESFKKDVFDDFDENELQNLMTLLDRILSKLEN